MFCFVRINLLLKSVLSIPASLLSFCHPIYMDGIEALKLDANSVTNKFVSQNMSLAHVITRQVIMSLF